MLERRRIVAVDKDGIRPPAFVKVVSALYRAGIGGRVCKRDLVAAVVFEGDGAGEAE